MSVSKHWLLGEWYPRGLIVHQQRYRPSDSNKNVDIKFSAHDALNSNVIAIYFLLLYISIRHSFPLNGKHKLINPPFNQSFNQSIYQSIKFTRLSLKSCNLRSKSYPNEIILQNKFNQFSLIKIIFACFICVSLVPKDCIKIIISPINLNY